MAQMVMTSEFKTCEECKGPTQFIECKSNPIAAEWYCDKCHRSYPAREIKEDRASKR